MERAVSLTVDERWDLVDRIAKRTVEVGAYKPTLKDALADLTVRPATGIPIAIAVIFGLWAFFCNFAGALFTDGFLVRLFDVQWLPWIQAHFPAAPGSTAYYIFVGDPAATNCFEAFGVLTSGLFVAFGVVLPAIIAFYLVLTILEDIGYIPRLAVLVDTVLHKIGLHGYAIVPAILSLGCNIPGVAATRPLETRKQRFMMMTLLAVFIPCGAQIGVMLALIPNLIIFVFLALALGLFTFGFLLSKVWPGESPEILIDVPPFRMPTWGNIWRKLWTRVGHFLKVAVPFVLLGCVIVMILYVTGAMDHIASGLSPVFTGMFGLPEDVVAPLVAGFLRKDLAVGMLGGISMTTWQMVSSVILLCVYFPCLATFALMIKELRGKEIAATFGFLIAMIFIYGGILHLIGMAAGVA
jgi:ferrous iron transport protein B